METGAKFLVFQWDEEKIKKIDFAVNGFLRGPKNLSPQKEMVPSDLISSLARHGHAPYQALRPGAPGASLFRSPDAGFSSPRIKALQRTAAF